MLNLKRTNRMGMEFSIRDIFTPDRSFQTRIQHGKDFIIVNHSIDEINQAWYNWQQRGDYIQVAFSFLTEDEREFILSGLTPEQWSGIFPKEAV